MRFLGRKKYPQVVPHDLKPGEGKSTVYDMKTQGLADILKNAQSLKDCYFTLRLQNDELKKGRLTSLDSDKLKYEDDNGNTKLIVTNYIQEIRLEKNVFNCLEEDC